MITHVTILIILVVVQPAISVIPCTLINSTFPLANDTINKTCTSVAFVNVTAQGNMMINLSIAAMVQANPTAMSLNVTMKNVSLLNGTVLLIDSGGASSTNSPHVSIFIQNLRGTDGALVFRGSFPAGTSILVTDANMSAKSSAAPKLAQFDTLNPTYAKIVMLVNFSMRNNASFFVKGSIFTATNGIPMYITGPLLVANATIFEFASCNWTASSATSPYSYAFCMLSSPASISNASQWTFTSCSWTASTSLAGSVSYALYMLSSPATISSLSQWTFTSCNWTASSSPGYYSYAFPMLYSPATISSSSQWSFTSCSWAASSTASDTYALYMFYSPATINSIKRFLSCLHHATVWL